MDRGTAASGVSGESCDNVHKWCKHAVPTQCTLLLEQGSREAICQTESLRGATTAPCDAVNVCTHVSEYDHADCLYDEGRIGEALALYLAAGKCGCVCAEYKAGLILYDVDANEERTDAAALSHLTRAANSGHVPAMYMVAIIHLDDDPASTLRDVRAGVQSLRRCAVAGDPIAAFELGDILANGLYGVPVNLHLAKQLFVNSARRGHVGAQFTLGNAWLKVRAKAGDVDAQCILGERLVQLARRCVPSQASSSVGDCETALTCKRSESDYDAHKDKGNPTANDARVAEGVSWLRRSVESGCGRAMLALGRHLARVVTDNSVSSAADTGSNDVRDEALRLLACAKAAGVDGAAEAVPCCFPYDVDVNDRIPLSADVFGGGGLGLGSRGFPSPFERECDGGFGFYDSTSVGFKGRARTLRELEIVRLSAAIREKRGWDTKRTDPSIVDKWQREAISQGTSPAVFNYVLRELDHFSRLRCGAIEAGGVDGTWIAHGLVGGALHSRLIECVLCMEDVPAHVRDWHPGSKGSVLNLVHPSLYCYVHGVTCITQEAAIPPLRWMGAGAPDIGPRAEIHVTDGMSAAGPHSTHDSSGANQGTNAPWMPQQRDDGQFASRTYQWLPAEFDVRSDGKVSIASYVNNLHPWHCRAMYRVLEDVFSLFVPLFSRVLTDLAESRELPKYRRVEFLAFVPREPHSVDDMNEDDDDHQERDYGSITEDDNCDAVCSDSEDWAALTNAIVTDAPLHPNDSVTHVRADMFSTRSGASANVHSDGNDGQGLAHNGSRDHAIATPAAVDPWEPRIPRFAMPTPPARVVDLRGRRLQVIVKMANTVLTPDNPDYEGGVWHVEGMQNESIVATGIYYYSCDNLTESRLHFRSAIAEPRYDRDPQMLRTAYGITDRSQLTQVLGSVLTSEGVCLAFPNTLQHRVSPFGLADQIRSGVRRTLVFFLVDPTKHVLSTLNVPPQQRHWLQEAVAHAGGHVRRLPPELLAQIMDRLAWPMSHEDALRHREALMKERKYIVDEQGRECFERTFSLCEH